MMSSGQASNICVQCGKEVEVFNNDVIFSLNLHMQSHKSLESVAAHLNQPNDLKQFNSNLGELDFIFKNAPKSIKSHKNFIRVNQMYTSVCIVCDSTINEYSSLIPHLKSVNHEQQVIAHLKKLIPSTKLRGDLNSIAFQTSNLSCSLCKCKIKMNSANMFETIVNIFLHNSLPEHISRVSNRENHNTEKQDISIARPTFQYCSSNIENQSSVESTTIILFKCLRCDYLIKYDAVLNKSNNSTSECNSLCNKEPLRNNIEQFVCKGFEISHFCGVLAHKCVFVNSTISCTLCKVALDVPNIDLLISHILGADKSDSDTVHSDLTIRLENVSITSPGSVEANSIEIAPKRVVNLSVLLSSLPESLKDVKHLSQTEDGCIICNICACQLPPTCSNVEAHLKGNVHKKKLVKSFLIGLPQHQNETCISVNDDLHILCSTCNCMIQPNALCLEQHLKGYNHKKNALRTLLPQELHYLDCFILTESKKAMCTLCDCHIKLSSIKQHLKQETHKNNLLSSLVSSLPPNYKNLSFITITDLSKIQCSICNVVIDSNFFDLRNHLEKNHINLLKMEEQNLSCILSMKDNEICSLLLPTDNSKEVMCSVCMVKISFSQITIVEHFKGIKHKKKAKRSSVTKPEEILKQAFTVTTLL